MDSVSPPTAPIPQQPLVSVIMNCYDGEQYLREAIDSVVAQTYGNWEIIFWDNQSSDRSANIVKSYSDPRIKYFFAPTHTWLYEARNYAIDKARGEFYAFLDVDDWWLPDKLERQLALFSNPRIGLVCGNFWVISERKSRRWRYLDHRAPTGSVLNALFKSYFVGMSTLVVRRIALESLSYRCDPRYHLIGDFDLVVRLSIHWNMDCVHEPVAAFRLHDNNITTDKGRHVDELESWLAEMSQIEAIRSCRNLSFFAGDVTYRKARRKLAQGDKRGAFFLFNDLPWGKQKLRLGFVLSLPGFLLRRLSAIRAL